ncbi:acyl-CoA thioesterase [Cohnella abietis]|uniref:Putative acyl-CoA thioester hydrolase YkhA n=1 Tax=Cohnella abietis TaxID=2507935 RepID=A0A3T1D6H6_9BACL|nr:acyl-CoA thioesterase [Cohnella abietis]BBI33687.1 putative acyl-CoA thioester hydrolase YkhA [Cohnella abietis]
MTEDARPVSRSRSIMTELVFPTDTNHHGTMFGGTLMKYIDKISAIAAMRHSNKPVVTASTDSLDFLSPIRMGEAVELEAFVTSTHRSSMEVYVVVRAENLFTGERRVTCTAFSTFVAVDENGKPVPVPAAIPENEAEQKLFDSAPERYDLRKKRRSQRYSSTE